MNGGPKIPKQQQGHIPSQHQPTKSPTPPTARKSPASSQAIPPTNILSREVSIEQKIKQANPHFADLHIPVQRIAVRSIENKLTQGRSPLKSSDENGFKAAVAESIDFALMISTLAPSQQSIAKSMIGKRTDIEIKDAVRLGVLSEKKCDELTKDINDEPEDEMKQALLHDFTEGLPNAIADARYEKFKKDLQPQGFNILPAKDDGNCFYDALIKSGITPEEESANPQMQLRKDLHATAQSLLDLYYTPNGEPTEFLNDARAEMSKTHAPNSSVSTLWNEFINYYNLISLTLSDDITKDKKWADSSYAILVAIGKGHPIHLHGPAFTDNAGKSTPMIFDINIDGTRLETKPYSIVFNGKNHFDALVKRT